MEQVKNSPKKLEKIRDELTHHELIVDRAEQPIERPSSYEEQKKYYSGKKKRHTLKNQLIVLPEGEDIVDVVVGKPGPTSDIRICREVLDKFDPEQCFSGDKAYLGESQIRTPSKKPKNGELTREQKEANKVLSSQRIFVEQLIRFLKIFKVLPERFRLNKKRYKSVFLTVCGLVRLRIKAVILKLIKWTESEPVIDVTMGYSFGEKLDFET